MTIYFHICTRQLLGPHRENMNLILPRYLGIRDETCGWSAETARGSFAGRLYVLDEPRETGLRISRRCSSLQRCSGAANVPAPTVHAGAMPSATSASHPASFGPRVITPCEGERCCPGCVQRRAQRGYHRQVREPDDVCCSVVGLQGTKSAHRRLVHITPR